MQYLCELLAQQVEFALLRELQVSNHLLDLCALSRERVIDFPNKNLLVCLMYSVQ